MWDRERAISFLNSQASAISHGRCAEYTRKAIEAGGVLLTRHLAAKDYEASLRAVGFLSLGQMPGEYLPGDVVIVDAIKGHPYGHMAMFNGFSWVSDFKQQHGLYPSPTYRSKRPRYTIFRFGVRWDSVKLSASANLA